MPYYCGWDGGGTKTEVLITDATGNCLADSTFGPLNLNGASEERVRGTIRDSVAYMAQQPEGLEGCAALVIGMAGISNTDAVKLITDQVRECGYQGLLRIAGDQDIALAGSVRGPGAVLVAGTGSICSGKNAAGEAFRSGGYGYLIDDCGSGYAIGRDILTAVVRAEDGRGPETVLRKLVFDALQVSDVRGIITWLYAPTTGKKEIASLSALLLKALPEGDAASEAIARKAADDLADMALALWHRAGLTGGELALTGSITRHYPLIRSLLEEKLAQACPGMKVVDPWGTPAQGAACLAVELTAK